MATGFAAFRYALVGFALPYCFVLRPDLLILPDGGGFISVLSSIGITVIGLIPLAQSVTGRLVAPHSAIERAALMLGALGILILGPATDSVILVIAGVLITIAIGALNFRRARALR